MVIEPRGDHFVIIHAGKEIDYSFSSEKEAWSWADKFIDDQMFDSPNDLSPPLSYRAPPGVAMTSHFRSTASSMARTLAPSGWSTEFAFEEIEIEEEGIHFGSFWGTAELAVNDPRDGDFYVKTLAISGQKRERERIGGYSLSIMKRTPAVLLMRRPAGDDRTFQAHLFRKIEAALYASEEAREWFAGEIEAA